jgi:hypothetical protein
MANVVNVKVKYIRPKYETLAEWMEDSQNMYIGRSGVVFINNERFPKQSSNWANPYTVKKYGREKCLELYEEWIRSKIVKEGNEELLKLKDKVLGCWCKPNSCHGDILVKIIKELQDTE